MLEYNKVITFRDCNMSQGLTRYLENANIHTLNEVASRTYDNILDIDGIGVGLRDKLKVMLSKWGMDFAREVKDPITQGTIIIEASQSKNFEKLSSLMAEQQNYINTINKLQKAVDDNVSQQKIVLNKIKSGSHLKEEESV